MTSIRQAFIILPRMVRLLWDDLFTLMLCNLAWLVLCLPIVTAPASFAALYCVADMAAREKPISTRDFFTAFRQYFVKGLLLGLIDLALAVVVVANLLFYSQLAASWAQIARAVWIAVGIFWILVQVYLFPMLVVQLQPSIKWALRNALMMTLAQPIFTLVVALEAVMLLAISAALVFPVAAISMSMVALFTCVALNDRLDYLKVRQKTETS
jgi:uncharacterized membrane protein YesL